MKERFETFTVLINKISRNIRKIKNQEMAEYGLRSTHVTCLYYLYSAKSLTATELCERCADVLYVVTKTVVGILNVLTCGVLIEIKRLVAEVLGAGFYEMSEICDDLWGLCALEVVDHFHRYIPPEAIIIGIQNQLYIILLDLSRAFCTGINSEVVLLT